MCIVLSVQNALADVAGCPSTGNLDSKKALANKVTTGNNDDDTSQCSSYRAENDVGRLA